MAKLLLDSCRHQVDHENDGAGPSILLEKLTFGAILGDGANASTQRYEVYLPVCIPARKTARAQNLF